MLRDLNMSTRLFITFFLIAIFSLGAAVLNLYGIIWAGNNLKFFNFDLAERAVFELYAEKGISQILWAESILINSNLDITDRQYAYKSTESAWASCDSINPLYKTLPLYKADEVLWNTYITINEELRKSNQQLIDLSKEKDKLVASGVTSQDPRILTIENQCNQLYLTDQKSGKAILEALDQALTDFSNRATKAVPILTRQSAALMISGIIIFLFSISSILICSIYLTRSVNKPIKKALARLREGAKNIATASNQLAATSRELSQGSCQQASAIEETSSTLQESASTLQQNSANTNQAAQISENAKIAAENGSREMESMMSAISDIKKSSDQIAKVIKVIDDIAFQTNILALNAAVEAARAGEAGMGFSVVAEEVRNLAQRSAQAAKDTTAIIESNIELSGNGVMVAEKVRKALNEITIQAKKVNQLMEEIAIASLEQARGFAQVNKAINQIEGVTEQNASNAEESSSASDELNTQAHYLWEIVRQLSEIVNGKAAAEKELNLPVGIISKSMPLAIPETIGAAKKTKIIAPNEIIPLGKDKDPV